MIMIKVPLQYLQNKLIKACTMGDMHEIDFLVRLVPGGATCRTHNDFNPLLTSLYYGQNVASQFLLLNGEHNPSQQGMMRPLLKPSLLQNKHGSGPLHVAAYRWNISGMQMLINHCQFFRTLHDLLNSTDEWGKTALHQAVYHNFIQGVELLLSLPETDTTIEDANGKTAEDYCDHTKEEILCLFQQRTCVEYDNAS